MAAFEHTVHIRRPREVVFDFLTVPENNLTWQPTLIDARGVTPGPIGVGWRFRESRTVLGRVLETEFEVQRFDPPSYSEILAVSGPARIRASYRLLTRGHATLVIAVGTIPDCAVSRLAMGVVARAARKEIAKAMERLKATVESVPASGRPLVCAGAGV
jgi:uncharacterized protein YndB with AHSA1/START domain